MVLKVRRSSHIGCLNWWFKVIVNVAYV